MGSARLASRCPSPVPCGEGHTDNESLRPTSDTGATAMPIATPEIYAQMLDRAKQKGFAYPAINVTSTQTLNAALKGLADAESDGIIQISTGGAEYLSGQHVKDMGAGAAALAEFAGGIARKYPIHVALHTHHCPTDKLGERGRYILAATFGTVHGVYKPGKVKLRPGVLKEIQDAVGAKYGRDKPFDLVFHGGSGSAIEEIREAIGYGVVKMNVDTDMQYAFTRPVAAHMFTNYDGVLKVDGEVGSKKAYDPRTWGKAAEASMAARVTQACQDLLSVGTKL